MANSERKPLLDIVLSKGRPFGLRLNTSNIHSVDTMRQILEYQLGQRRRIIMKRHRNYESPQKVVVLKPEDLEAVKPMEQENREEALDKWSKDMFSSEEIIIQNLPS